MKSHRGTAVVTGAAGGIGQAMVMHLLNEGYNVALVDLIKPGLGAYAQVSDRVASIVADVCDETSLRAAVTEVCERFGGAHVLMVNAGIGPSGGISDTGIDDWKAILEINLTGAFNTMKAFMPVLAAAVGHRSVVITSSVLATRGARNMAAYSASKAGLIGLMQTAAQEFGAAGITVNGLAPGPIRTPLLERLAGDTLADLEKIVPIRRLGTPDDVAKAALFLCGEDAGFITGQLLVIDGGLNGRAYWRDA